MHVFLRKKFWGFWGYWVGGNGGKNPSTPKMGEDGGGGKVKFFPPNPKNFQNKNPRIVINLGVLGVFETPSVFSKKKPHGGNAPTQTHTLIPTPRRFLTSLVIR